MPDMPRIEVRAARPYLGRALTTSIDREAADVVRQFAELRRWLHAHGRETTGAPFIRYREIEMPHRLAIEACLPIASMAQGSGGIVADDLPAGRYAVLEHVGPLDGLVAANERLQRWAEESGLHFDMRRRGPASLWQARTETYLTDPAATHDPGSTRTELAYRLAD